MFVPTVTESFSYFFTADMLWIIVDCTNAEAEEKISRGAAGEQISDRWFPLCDSLCESLKYYFIGYIDGCSYVNIFLFKQLKEFLKK